MKDIIVEFLQFLSIELTVMMVAAMPIIELRGAIPIGISMGLSPLNAAAISYLGSVLPVPVILFGIRPIFDILRRNSFFRKIIDKIIYNSSVKHSKKIQKYGTIGLILLVAIPLPGTGVWSGSLAAALMNIRFKLAFPAILAGNLIAAIAIMTLSHGVSSVLS
jgi:uncharacterized membrane protein